VQPGHRLNRPSLDPPAVAYGRQVGSSSWHGRLACEGDKVSGHFWPVARRSRWKSVLTPFPSYPVGARRPACPTRRLPRPFAFWGARGRRGTCGKDSGDLTAFCHHCKAKQYPERHDKVFFFGWRSPGRTRPPTRRRTLEAVITFSILMRGGKEVLRDAHRKQRLP
jgi:hypothetical protein